MREDNTLIMFVVVMLALAASIIAILAIRERRPYGVDVVLAAIMLVATSGLTIAYLRSWWFLVPSFPAGLGVMMLKQYIALGIERRRRLRPRRDDRD